VPGVPGVPGVPTVTLAPLEVPLGLAVPAVRPEPLDPMPGSAADDPLLRLAAGRLVGHPTCVGCGSPKPSTPTSATAAHRVLTRKGGTTAPVALAPPVVGALDDYLGDLITAASCRERREEPVRAQDRQRADRPTGP
jgi:hypothetical protein